MKPTSGVPYARGQVPPTLSSSDDRDDAVVLARITTRRMTGEELRAVRDADEARVRASAPRPRRPSELDVLPLLRLSAVKELQVKAYSNQRGLAPGEAAVVLGYASEDDLIAAEAELTAGAWMSREQLDRVTELVALAEPLCRAMMVLPVSVNATTKKLTVAMRDPQDPDVLKTLAEHGGGWSIVPVRAGATALLETIKRVTTKVGESDPSSWIER